MLIITPNLDIVKLNFIFRGGKSPYCIDSSDVNDDGVIDISDVVFLLNHLFQNGKNPPLPYPDAGTDTTDDRLSDCGKTF